MPTEVFKFCRDYKACASGRRWALQFRTMQEVWDNCVRPDWLLWIAIVTGTITRRRAIKLAILAADCVLSDSEILYHDLDALISARRVLRCDNPETRAAAESAGFRAPSPVAALAAYTAGTAWVSLSAIFVQQVIDHIVDNGYNHWSVKRKEEFAQQIRSILGQAWRN